MTVKNNNSNKNDNYNGSHIMMEMMWSYFIQGSLITINTVFPEDHIITSALATLPCY